jgi:hypothetical protein
VTAAPANEDRGAVAATIRVTVLAKGLGSIHRDLRGEKTGCVRLD